MEKIVGGGRNLEEIARRKQAVERVGRRQQCGDSGEEKEKIGR